MNADFGDIEYLARRIQDVDDDIRPSGVNHTVRDKSDQRTTHYPGPQRSTQGFGPQGQDNAYRMSGHTVFQRPDREPGQNRGTVAKIIKWVYDDNLHWVVVAMCIMYVLWNVAFILGKNWQ